MEDWRHYVRVLLEKPFALPFASAVRHALQTGELPSHWERLRQDLVARRRDGNHEFARILELAATHPLADVDGALLLAAERPDWTADTVRHLLAWLKQPSAAVAPLDAGRYPAYQLALPLPDLARYNTWRATTPGALQPLAGGARMSTSGTGTLPASVPVTGTDDPRLGIVLTYLLC